MFHLLSGPDPIALINGIDEALAYAGDFLTNTARTSDSVLIVSTGGRAVAVVVSDCNGIHTNRLPGWKAVGL